MFFRFILILIPFLLTLACERENIGRDSKIKSYTVEWISPDEQWVQQSDTLVARFRLSPNDSIGFDQLLINDRPPLLENGIYHFTFNTAGINQALYTLRLDFIFEDDIKRTDSIQVLFYRFSGPFPAGEMVVSRSNHSSIYHSASNRIISSGGVSHLQDSALSDFEYYDIGSERSGEMLFPILKHGRAGHAMVYESSTETWAILGGGTRQYASDPSNRIPLPFELIRNNVKEFPNTSLYQDFAHYYDHPVFFTHGGVKPNEGYLSNAFKYEIKPDSIVQKLFGATGVVLGEHAMIDNPKFPNEILFMGSTFSNFGSYTTSISLSKDNFSVFFENYTYLENRNEHAMVRLPGNAALSTGGFSIDVSGQQLVLGSMEVLFFPNGGSYKLPQAFSTARASHTMVSVDNNIFIFGGYDNEGRVLKSIERFTIIN